MAKHEVGIVFKAYDEATLQFDYISKSADKMTQRLMKGFSAAEKTAQTAIKSSVLGGADMSGMMKKMAAYAATYLGVRQIKRWASSALDVYSSHQEAVQNLTDALSLQGKVTLWNLMGMQKFAAEMERLTTIEDSTILNTMALGASMGKMSGTELQNATKAAIGLSRGLDKDLDVAMTMIAKSAHGFTRGLGAVGVQLQKGMTNQQILNAVIARGTELFKIAEGETLTYSGAIAQMKNAIHDWAKVFGFALAPQIIKVSDRIKNMSFDTIKSAFYFTKWVVSIGAAVIIAPKIVAAIIGIHKAIKGLGKASAIVQALSGPVGWATLAVGAGIALTTGVMIDKAFGDMNVDMAEFQKQAAVSAIEVNKMTGAIDKSLAGIDDTPLRSLKKQINGITESEIALNTAIMNLTRDRFKPQTIGKETYTGIDLDKLVEVRKQLQAVAEEAPYKKIAEQLKALKQEIMDFGKSEGTLLIEQMIGAGFSEQAMEFARWNLSRKSFLKDQQSLNQAIIETEKDLVDQIATIHMTAGEKQIWKLEQAGATAQEIARIKALNRQVEAGDKGKTGRSVQQGLQPMEGQYLTFAPGREFKMNYEEQTAKGVIEQVKSAKKHEALLVKIAGHLDELVRRGRLRPTIEATAFP